MLSISLLLFLSHCLIFVCLITLSYTTYHGCSFDVSELGTSPRDSPRPASTNVEAFLEAVDISKGYDELEEERNRKAEGRADLNSSQNVKAEATNNDGSHGLEPMDFASLSDALFEYASNGLRTLVLAKRDLTEAEGLFTRSRPIVA